MKLLDWLWQHRQKNIGVWTKCKKFRWQLRAFPVFKRTELWNAFFQKTWGQIIYRDRYNFYQFHQFFRKILETWFHWLRKCYSSSLPLYPKMLVFFFLTDTLKIIVDITIWEYREVEATYVIHCCEFSFSLLYIHLGHFL